jgi:HlyD family secretion protein
VSGFQRRILLDAGDLVRKGQIVAELEPLRSETLDPRSRAEAEAAVAAAEASVKAAEERLRAAEAEAAYAKVSHERTKQLYDAGSAALDNLEQSFISSTGPETP